jgi:hypothetical protein
MEYLELLGVSRENWECFRSGPDFTEQEQQTLLRLLLLLPRVPQARLWEWLPSPDPPSAKSVDAVANRGTLHHLQGRVLNVTELSVAPSQAGLLGFTKYYACEMKLDPERRPVRVFTRYIPGSWQDYLATADSWNERAAAFAVFVKQNDDDASDHRTAVRSQTISKGLASQPDRPSSLLPEGEGAEPRALYVAPRIAWFPDSATAVDGVPSDHAFLAGLGFDVGCLDSVEEKAPLTVGDREAFYQLLETMERANPKEFERRSRPASIGNLLTGLETNRGRIFRLTGTARRIVKVYADPDVVPRLGSSHYYEIELFIDPEALVRIRRSNGDFKEFVSYPVTYCCRRIPEGVPTGGNVSVPVSVVGVYLKNWAYHSRFVSDRWSEEGESYLQLSPLLIGRCPEAIPEEHYQVSQLGHWFVSLFFVGLLGALALVWWIAREQRQTSALVRRMRDVRAEFDPQVLESSDEP